MRGKLMFISGLAAGFVLGSRAGREKYEEIRANAKKVWEHPTVQEAAGVAQAQANKLYTEGKGKLDQSKLGQKLHTSGSTPGSSTRHREASIRSARLVPAVATVAATTSRPGESAASSAARSCSGSTSACSPISRYSASLATPVGAALA